METFDVIILMALAGIIVWTFTDLYYTCFKK